MIRTGLTGAALAVVITLLPLHAVQAQQVYRQVTPDGRVIFSDVPPQGAPARASTAPDTGTAQGGTATLPYALRQVVQRYPVVLYTAPDCGPCDSGRALLAARGVPYSERTITTDEDGKALQRLSGERNIPLLTIGGQHIKGYASSEWQQYLDAAGYPKTSALPSGWRPPAPSPLAPRQAPAPAERPAAPATLEPAPAQPGPAPDNSNPAGIRF